MLSKSYRTGRVLECYEEGTVIMFRQFQVKALCNLASGQYRALRDFQISYRNLYKDY